MQRTAAPSWRQTSILTERELGGAASRRPDTSEMLSIQLVIIVIAPLVKIRRFQNLDFGFLHPQSPPMRSGLSPASPKNVPAPPYPASTRPSRSALPVTTSLMGLRLRCGPGEIIRARQPHHRQVSGANLRRRTPAPPPFSSMNSTPAASWARRDRARREGIKTRSSTACIRKQRSKSGGNSACSYGSRNSCCKTSNDTKIFSSSWATASHQLHATRPFALCLLHHEGHNSRIMRQPVDARHLMRELQTCAARVLVVHSDPCG
jgi:hypothetical protein